MRLKNKSELANKLQIKQDSPKLDTIFILYKSSEKFIHHQNIYLEKRSGKLEDITLLETDLDEEMLSHISTDHIIRVKHLLTDDLDVLADKALCGLPEKYQVTEGDFKRINATVLVAGHAFGIGSSREQAVWALVKAGVKLVIAPSFGPIFEKNAAHVGLLTSTNTALAKLIHRKEPVPFEELAKNRNPLIQNIIQAGGLFKYLHQINSGKLPKPTVKSYKKKYPMNVWEKRLAKVIKTNTVQVQDMGLLPVDCAYSYVGLSGLSQQILKEVYGDVFKPKLSPNKIFFFEDHFPYSPDPQIKKLTKNQRKFARQLKIPKKNYFKGRLDEGGGAGICHRVMMGKIDPRKTQVVIATDSHTTTLGVLPILPIPEGSTFFAAAIAEGQIPFSVDPVMRVELVGKLPPGLIIRDVQLKMAATIKPPQGTTVVEFGGPGLNTLSFDQVTALCNMVPEVFHAQIAITESFKAGASYLCNKFKISPKKARALYAKPDKNCQYSHKVIYDLSTTAPWIALPGNPNNAVSLAQLKKHPQIDKAYIASCACGLQELKEAATILKGKEVASGVQFIIIPSSKAIYHQAKKQGIIKIFENAGAIVRQESACSACIGQGSDAAKEEEIAISATNRNFPGRMGAKSAQVYLGGSILVSISAILGKIPTSREYNNEIQNIANKNGF